MSKEILTLNLLKLNEDQRTNPENYNVYLKKYKALKSKIKNYNSPANQIKRAGIKVTKSEVGYVFNGSNIVAEVFLDGCVIDYWSINLISGSESIKEEIAQYGYEFPTKADAMGYLLNLELNS